MRERIAQFLTYRPRHKLVFAPAVSSSIRTVDVGFELASRLKDKLLSAHISMIAEDELNSLLKTSIHHDDMIGDYIALRNWGILFEPELKFNLLSIFDSYSKTSTLILIDCGIADNDNFHLVDKHFNQTLPLGKLSPFIIS